MIIFLHGQDPYRVGQKLKEIAAGYMAKNQSGFNYSSFDFSEDDFGKFDQTARSSSLIPEKKLLICKNIFKADAAQMLDFLKSLDFAQSRDIILVFAALIELDKKGGRILSDKEKKLFECLVKKPNLVSEFPALRNFEIKPWARRFADSLGVEFTGEALDFIVLSCGPNLFKLDSEIRKAAVYKPKGIVGRADLEKILVPSLIYNIFELTDALAAKNRKRAVEALFKSLDGGEISHEVLGLLAWQARNLLKFKADPAKAARLKLHPFVLQKTKEAAALFSREELALILKKISKLDLSLKTSDAGEKTALSLLISEL